MRAELLLEGTGEPLYRRVLTYWVAPGSNLKNKKRFQIFSSQISRAKIKKDYLNAVFAHRAILDLIR